MANEYISVHVEREAMPGAEVPTEGTDCGTAHMDQLLQTIARAAGQISYARSEPHADKGFVSIPKENWEALKATPDRWTALQESATATGFRFVE
jgi:hypothetical protein